MSDEDVVPPEARSVRSRWPGLIWAVPLAALLIVGYLGIRALSRRGIDVTVTFGYVEGVTPGDTKVLMKGVEVGHVSRVHALPDGHHAEVTLSLDPRVRDALNSNTAFWLIGEFPTITDIQSIRAAVAGVIIAMAPGTGGTPARHFTGLDQPPLVLPGTSGSYYYLTSPSLGSIQPGAALLYRGLAIGKIVRTALHGPGDFRLEAFVTAPYDRLVRRGSSFWTGSPLRLSLSGGSLSAGLASPGSVLQGSVQFEQPVGGAPPAAPGSLFPLYADEGAAQLGAPGPEQLYRVTFQGTGGDLARGANVTLLGASIGEVRSSLMVPAPRPRTDAVLALYPHRLGVTLADAAPADQWRQATDAAVTRLLRQGYRAQLTQSPPLVGARGVALATAPGARGGSLAPGAPPTIPASTGGDDLLTRLNRLPIEQIGENIRRLTGNLAAITGSHEVKDGVVHLDATLRQLDAITRDVQPKIAPLLNKLDQTAAELQGTAAAARATLSGEGAAQGTSLPEAIGQLDQAARSIRSLTDYLGRHPEALLRGKAKEKK